MELLYQSRGHHPYAENLDRIQQLNACFSPCAPNIDSL